MTGKPVILIVLDGWGISLSKEGNAVAQARTPIYDSLLQNHPHTRLYASGEHVGLPEGQMGNSEVGHLNLGAGRIVYQDITRITKSIRDGNFFTNSTLMTAMATAKKNDSALHLMGLLSDGGVHSHMDHILAMFDMAKAQGLTRVFFHAFLDGRDTPPASALEYIGQLEKHLASIGIGRIATVSGRYYAMDRDKRWERVQKAYEALTMGEGIRMFSAVDAVKDSYEHKLTDEFMLPTVIFDQQGNAPVGTMADGDVAIFCNFRSDRAREITRTLTDPTFDGFPRLTFPKLADVVCLTTYDETFKLSVAYPPVRLSHILGQGLHQLRIAETEKYAHVTFFFNGGEEQPFPLEDRVLIPSPREVATYDLKPEMSAREVTDELVKRIGSKKYSFILVNYANPDMVGHTGILVAAVKAAEVIDECLGRVLKAAQETGAVVMITADHGNLEVMTDKTTGQPHTAHTTDPVPFILVGDNSGLRGDGCLADVAPTVLQFLDIGQPAEMKGKSLIV
jgi:2,3-bisphosphoglycerate-independent phosphoglycerate mutase